MRKCHKGSKYHPNLNVDYFENVNSKEKAYWLGYLYADGNISIDKRKRDTKYLILETTQKDEFLIDRFAQLLVLTLNTKDLLKGMTP